MDLLGIISDTHGRAETARRAVEILRARGATRLVHLGDVGSEAVLDALAGLDATVVFGNCDDARSLGRYAQLLGIAVAHPSAVLELKIAEVEVVEVEVADVKVADVKVADVKVADVKVVDVKVVEVKVADVKVVDVKVVEVKVADVKVVEMKAVEIKAVEAKAVETRSETTRERKLVEVKDCVGAKPSSGHRRIGLTHGHLEDEVARLFVEAPDYLLHGHTHEIRDELVGTTRVLNPGALSRAARLTALLLDPATGAAEWIEIDA